MKFNPFKISSDRRLVRAGKACCIALLAFILSRFVAYDITSLSYFAPLEKASDYIASDFYAQVMQQTSVKKYEDRIAVVTSDHLDRTDLSHLFKSMADGAPSVTAIDITFDVRGDDSDHALIDAINGLGKVVFPIACTEAEAPDNGRRSIYQYIETGIPGVVNLDAESARSIIRTFTPSWRHADGKDFLSMSAAAAKAYDTRLWSLLSHRGNDHEQIDFTDTEIDIFSPEDIIADPSLITDRIVFVGDMADFSDIHATPIDEAMPGVMIHALSTATILSGNYITNIPRWVQWLIAFLACMPMIYAQLSLEDTKIGNILVRWLQVIMLLILIITGTMLYSKFRISLDLTLPLLMIALGLLAADIWAFACGIWDSYAKKTITRIKTLFPKIC